MKYIKFSDFLFYKKIKITLNIAFILILVLSNILIFISSGIIKDIKIVRSITLSIFLISLFIFLLFIFWSFFHFYKNDYIFFIKMKKDFWILFVSIFLSILLGIICLYFIFSYDNDQKGREIFKKLFFYIISFIIPVIFVGISINIRIFLFWQIKDKKIYE